MEKFLGLHNRKEDLESSNPELGPIPEGVRVVWQGETSHAALPPLGLVYGEKKFAQAFIDQFKDREDVSLIWQGLDESAD